MAISWFPVPVAWIRSPGAVRLAASLGPAGLGYALRLWAWAAEQTEDGFIGADLIRIVVDIHEADSESIPALVAAGVIEPCENGFHVTGWRDGIGAQQRKVAKHKAKMRRLRAGHVPGTESARDEHVMSTDSSRDEHVPDKTRLDKTKTRLSKASPPPPPSTGGESAAPAEQAETLRRPAVPALLLACLPGSESSAPAEQAETPWDRVVAVWTRTCVPAGFSRPRRTPQQAKQAAVRCREAGWFEAFEVACQALAADPFYRGQGARGWVATLGWLLQPGRAERTAERYQTASAGTVATDWAGQADVARSMGITVWTPDEIEGPHA